MTITDVQPATAAPPRSAFREPQFRRYLTGQSISGFGDQIWFVALSWSAVRLASPATAGLLLMLSSVPRLAPLLFAGVIADRFDIRRLMMGSDCLRAVLTLGAAGLAVATPGIALLVVLALTFGTVDAVFLPSAGAMRPRLLRPEQYQSGSVAAETTARLALCLGAPLGGIVVAFGHLPIALAIDGLTFVASVLTLATVRPRPIPVPAEPVPDNTVPDSTVPDSTVLASTGAEGGGTAGQPGYPGGSAAGSSVRRPGIPSSAR